MKIVVDFEICQSHGLCTEAAPTVFKLDDDGFLQILQESPPESLRGAVDRAVRECPAGAIRIEG
jgi:ferredoxin